MLIAFISVLMAANRIYNILFFNEKNVLSEELATGTVEWITDDKSVINSIRCNHITVEMIYVYQLILISGLL